MKKPTLQERASKYFLPWSWLAGYAAGKRDSRKQLTAFKAQIQTMYRQLQEAQQRATVVGSLRRDMMESRLPSNRGGFAR